MMLALVKCAINDRFWALTKVMCRVLICCVLRCAVYNRWAMMGDGEQAVLFIRECLFMDEVLSVSYDS